MENMTQATVIARHCCRSVLRVILLPSLVVVSSESSRCNSALARQAFVAPPPSGAGSVFVAARELGDWKRRRTAGSGHPPGRDNRRKVGVEKGTNASCRFNEIRGGCALMLIPVIGNTPCFVPV